MLSGHEFGVDSVIALPDGRLLSRDSFPKFRLWSPDSGGFRGESISDEESRRLSAGASSSGGGYIKCELVTAGYSVSRNSAVSESFGRLLVDGDVSWVVKVGDVIAVFQSNGRDYWFGKSFFPMCICMYRCGTMAL